MDFLGDNALLIITIALFIMFAILGYIVDKSKNKNKKEKEVLTENITDDFKPVQEAKEVPLEVTEEQNINLEDK